MRSHRPPRAGVRGFTLLEVLVSLAILAFGLLGVAGLQMAGMRNSHNADSRGTALYLAYDIIDRVRVNRYSCLQGSTTPVAPAPGFPGDCYDLVSSAAHYPTPTGGTPVNFVTPAVTCFGRNANCTPDQLATSELWNWQQRVAALLPRGEAVVCNDSSPADGEPSWVHGRTPGAALYGCDGHAVPAKTCAGCPALAPTLTVKVFWDDRLQNSTADTTTFRRLYLSFQP